jgi:hypothetical protein
MLLSLEQGEHEHKRFCSGRKKNNRRKAAGEWTSPEQDCKRTNPYFNPETRGGFLVVFLWRRLVSPYRLRAAVAARGETGLGLKDGTLLLGGPSCSSRTCGLCWSLSRRRPKASSLEGPPGAIHHRWGDRSLLAGVLDCDQWPDAAAVLFWCASFFRWSHGLLISQFRNVGVSRELYMECIISLFLLQDLGKRKENNNMFRKDFGPYDMCIWGANHLSRRYI